MSNAEINKMWSVFAFDGDRLFELRALWPKGLGETRNQPALIKHFRCQDYLTLDACKEAIQKCALDLNNKGYNIYAVMNPLKPEFKGQGAAKDSDVAYRDLLLIDIDRTGDSSQPADSQSIEAAQELAKDIKQFLLDQGWGNPIVVMSGNGYHLYYVLQDLSNDPDATRLVSQVLKALALRFNNDSVSIDTSVFNAARITKVPGTVMQKGITTVDRPYRMSVVCDDV